MSRVQPLSRSMIETFLRAVDLPHQVSEDGNLSAKIWHDDVTGTDLFAFFRIEGQSREIYLIKAYHEPYVPKKDWGRTMLACNKWNRQFRWPKAYLLMDEASDEDGILMLEEQVDLEKGTHQEFINNWTAAVLGGAIQFWKWAHQDGGL